MTEKMHLRVLHALSDGRERQIVAVRLFADSSIQEIQSLADRGLIRFPDVRGGGKRVCITPRGLELWMRHKKTAAPAAP